jgi:hypothetical protein
MGAPVKCFPEIRCRHDGPGGPRSELKRQVEITAEGRLGGGNMNGIATRGSGTRATHRMPGAS